MKINELNTRSDIHQNKKVAIAFDQLVTLLQVLNNRELEPELTEAINMHVNRVNAISASGKALKKQINTSLKSILDLIEKQHQLVTINHYRNQWMALGMAVFGLPLGIALGASLDNMGLLGIGLPIGIVIGLAVGKEKDKKALEEGRQLNLEIKL